MVLNLGGVGNVTYIEGETIVAFDTGPASAMIDDVMRRRFGRPYDAGGEVARAGRVDEDVLAKLMDNPFFDQPAPKSLDRQDFHARARIIEALPDADAVATLAAFTVAATVDALRHVPGKPRRWLVTGGGRTTPISCSAWPTVSACRSSRSRRWAGMATISRPSASATSRSARSRACP